MANRNEPDIYDVAARQGLQFAGKLMMQGALEEEKEEVIVNRNKLGAFISGKLLPPWADGKLKGHEVVRQTLEAGRTLGIDDADSAELINSIFKAGEAMEQKSGQKGFAKDGLKSLNQLLTFQGKTPRGKTRDARRKEAVEAEPDFKLALISIADKLRELDPEDREEDLAEIVKAALTDTETITDMDLYRKEIVAAAKILAANPDADVDRITERSLGGQFQETFLPEFQNRGGNKAAAKAAILQQGGE